MREAGKLGIKISAFGLGCMRFPMTKAPDGSQIVDESISTPIIRAAVDGGVNYVDTAYVYSNGLNEVYVGKALKDGYREKVYLATKLPTWACNSKEDMYKLFDKQLENLGTDYIDFYLVHSLNKDNWNKMRDLGVREFLTDLKASGKIKYACFSFHDDYAVFEEILNAYDWDMCQIQFNYMDIENQAGIKGLKLAGEKGIPVVVMEGLLGGKLASVPEEIKEVFDSYGEHRSPIEWAFRWIGSFPEVATILSGVTNLEQTADNLRIFENVEPGCMSDDELKIIDKVREMFRARIQVDCTGCAYCMPCPMGVEIPKVFAMWNESFMYKTKSRQYPGLINENKDASACVACGKCMRVCPQHLYIPELLKKAHKYLTE